MLSTSIRSSRGVVPIRFPICAGLALCAASVAAPAAAQGSAVQKPATAATQPARRPAVREDLQSAAATFELRARSEKDATQRARLLESAARLRARLADGDFQPGHRILLFVVGDSALSDTFTVRSDRKLLLPNLPEISLAGVLDSELQGYLETQLAQYIRNPSVRAQALLRVSVSGDVANPGFYSVRTDTPVSDVIMDAGGPSPSADLNKAVLRRGNTVVVSRAGMQEAFRSELTMTDIGARPGDEVFIPNKPTGSRWTKLAAATATVTGIVWTLVWISDRR